MENSLEQPLTFPQCLFSALALDQGAELGRHCRNDLNQSSILLPRHGHKKYQNSLDLLVGDSGDRQASLETGLPCSLGAIEEGSYAHIRNPFGLLRMPHSYDQPGPRLRSACRRHFSKTLDSFANPVPRRAKLQSSAVRTWDPRLANSPACGFAYFSQRNSKGRMKFFRFTYRLCYS